MKKTASSIGIGLRRRRHEQVIADAAAGRLGDLSELLVDVVLKLPFLGGKLFFKRGPSRGSSPAAAKSGSFAGSSLLAKTP